MLFTAHEFLGRRQWCTLDKGRLLLFILDIVVPKIRAPILDSVRECVTETIEQITYCLYGYPAKKARSRHIEEHDSSQIEMNWLQAQQVYDIYRPDNLPEFDSYKYFFFLFSYFKWELLSHILLFFLDWNLLQPKWNNYYKRLFF